MVFSVSSAAFRDGDRIPVKYTCQGQNVSPALSWSGAPSGPAAFALIMDDPDAPGGVFTHWVLFNLPAGTQSLPEGVAKTERLENGAQQGLNDFGTVGYGGPCPPPGSPHRYRFTLYALDAPVELGPGKLREQFLDAIKGHVLAEAQLVGVYGH